MDNLDDIKRKIAALLAKAKGTDNEAEAEIFMAKVEELLTKYQIDILEVNGGMDANDPIMDHEGVTFAASGHVWRGRLYRAVGMYYGCESIRCSTYIKDKNGRWIPAYNQRLVGRQSAIMTTDLMYPWIVEQVRAAAKKVAPQTGMSEQGQAKRIAAALIVRLLYLASRSKAAESVGAAAAKNALITVDAVRVMYDRLHPDSKPITKGRPGLTDELSREAAEGISLHRQTGADKALQIGSL